MTISSRTPEGQPNLCPVCGDYVVIEPSAGTHDAPCPTCGQLLWWFKQRGGDLVSSDRISAETDLSELAADSLAFVELVMELEEEFDIHIPEEVAAQIDTVGDAIRYIQEHRQGSE